jgi:uncharacterized membrane protein HdeD (DUF308 family)
VVLGVSNPDYAGEVVAQPRQSSALPYYVVSAMRSIIVLATGIVITFTPGHSARFGLVALGILGVVNAVGLGLVALGLSATETGRGLHLWQALVSLVVGALVLALQEAGMILLLWALVFWALLVGVAEIFYGARLARGDALRRDWITQGAMTVILGVVVLFQPADSVAVVGFLGAWAIVQGVYLAIASVALRFPTTPKDYPHD